MKLYKISNCGEKKELVLDGVTRISKETIMALISDMVDFKDNFLMDWENPND